LSSDKWIEAIRILEDKGCVFHTIYGGEPILYEEIDSLVEKLNRNKIKYTFITSGFMKERWLQIHKRHGIKGISASVDIVPDRGDRQNKSSVGKLFLSEMKEAGVNDVVAVTVLDEKNIQDDSIFDLVEELTGKGIVTEITLIDEPKSEWYDFAEPTGLSIKSFDRFNEIMFRLGKMKWAGYGIHNNLEFFQQAGEAAKNGYFCKKPFTSLTIEPDGTLRLCYRIGGNWVRGMKVFDLNKVEKHIEEAFERDREALCLGCSWNCIMMSEFLLTDKEYCKKVFRHNQ
jgi:MoaA/NifB/PqqE/SkfB family radical SAM enzyme